MKKLFMWLQYRASMQIWNFGDIIKQSIICIYGDFKQGENQEMCLNNLVFSQIF